MSGIFNPAIFNETIFNTGGVAPPVVVDVTKTGTGGIDGEGQRRIVKPSGLLQLPKKPSRVEQRIDDSREIQAEISERLSKEFTEESTRLNFRPVDQMTLREIDDQIGVLLRKKLKDDDEVMLLLMMACAHVT